MTHSAPRWLPLVLVCTLAGPSVAQEFDVVPVYESVLESVRETPVANRDDGSQPKPGDASPSNATSDETAVADSTPSGTPEPQAVAPKVVEPKVVEPKATEPSTPKVATPKVVEPQPVQPRPLPTRPEPMPIETARPEPVRPPAQPEPIRPQPARPQRNDPLDQLVDRAIDDTKRRLLVVIEAPGKQADENTPWQIAHGVLALRRDYDIVVNRKRVNAIDWIATGPTHNDKPWFLRTRWGGKGHPYTDWYQFEGHPNQFLAFFGTAGLPLDYTMIGETEDGRREPFTIADWIRNAQMEMNNREEITWTLWAFSCYMSPESRWVDQFNRGWSIEKLVRMQMDKPPTESACGGMHGLFAIANALNSLEKYNVPKRGVWIEAEQHLKRCIAAIKSMQNRDGSFSSNYLKGPRWEQQDIDKRISTTGHTLEFLMNALPESELTEPWIRRAVDRVARDLILNSTKALEPGGMYHACDSLVIYRERTRPEFKYVPPPARLAEQPGDEVSEKSRQPERTDSEPNLVPIPTPLETEPDSKFVKPTAGRTDGDAAPKADAEQRTDRDVKPAATMTGAIDLPVPRVVPASATSRGPRPTGDQKAVSGGPSGAEIAPPMIIVPAGR